MEHESKKALNKEFLDYHLSSSLPSMRTGLVFTFFLFFLFAITNKLLFSDFPEQQYHMRFGVIAPFILLSVIVMYIRPLRQKLQTVYIILNIFIAGAIFFVGATSVPSQPGYEYYFAWVMLVIIGLYIFFRLEFRTLILIGSLQMFSYIAATIFNGTYRENPFLFYNNLFFVISMASLGFFMTFILQSLNWKNFLHQAAISENYKKLITEIKERKQAEEALLASERQYHESLNAIPDWIYVVDREYYLVMINSSLMEKNQELDYPTAVQSRKLTEIYPFVTPVMLEEMEHVFLTGINSITEHELEFLGRAFYAETRIVPVFRDHKVHQVMTIIRDRSKEREVEELKLRNTQQKEIMLREIHHRVKNNLAIVISLLSLQMKNNDDPDLKRIIRDIEMRIRSMALIHEHLYRSENLNRIPLADYLQALSTIILGTFSGHHIDLITELEPTDVSIETALPLGLITNELLTNAVKYAFPDRQPGELRVIMRQDTEGIYLLSISDNGVGLPVGFRMEDQQSLGMFIIRLLVEQLDGSLSLDTTGGTSFSIRFRNLIANRYHLPTENQS
jgi:two-component sensor histidine kinase